MGLELAGLLTLYLLGRDHARGLPSPGPIPASLPVAAMIIPVTGNAPGVREAIASLAGQDYPGLELVFATATDDDPAVPLVEELMRRHPGRIFRATAGLAERQGQKNRNILAGIEFLRGRPNPPDVYLFCDSTHLARPDFAATLAAPLARGETVLASGFHRVVPLDFSPGTLAMLVTCLGLHMLQSIRPLTQPWGGAMAMTRAAFEDYGVAGLWAENIVDDCSMAAFLRKKGVVCLPVARAILDTPLAGMGLGRFGDWLTRQLLYLKFCFPGTWLGAVPAALAISLAPVAAVLILAGGLVGAFSAAAALGAAAYLAGLLGVGLAFRGLSPRPVPFRAFSVAYLATFFLIAWSIGRTCFTNTMVWRDIAYEVRRGGRVAQVIRRG
ncbi:MAG: glycosyltransferase [Desulfovibrio sp.]|nr:glycosyltransferase [Desulfovibrio sp.]